MMGGCFVMLVVFGLLAFSGHAGGASAPTPSTVVSVPEAVSPLGKPGVELVERRTRSSRTYLASIRLRSGSGQGRTRYPMNDNESLRDAVVELLKDPGCPYAGFTNEYGDDLRGRVTHRNPTRPIEVRAFREFARTRLGQLDRLHTEIDETIQAIGGARRSVIDPWSWPKRLALRLKGRPAATTDIYEVPAEYATKKTARRVGGQNDHDSHME